MCSRIEEESVPFIRGFGYASAIEFVPYFLLFFTAVLAWIGYRVLQPRGQVLAVIGALIVVVVGGLGARWFSTNRSNRSFESRQITFVSTQQPIGIITNGQYEQEQLEDGTLLLRMKDAENPVLTARTIGAEHSDPEELLVSGIVENGGVVVTQGFESSPLAFDSQARGIEWSFAGQRIYAWLVKRGPNITTVFKCTTPLDGEPQTACNSMLRTIHLDPDFQPQLETLEL